MTGLAGLATALRREHHAEVAEEADALIVACGAFNEIAPRRGAPSPLRWPAP